MSRSQAAVADVKIRRALPSDSGACARICFEAFSGISSAHNFPCDLPSVDFTEGILSMFLAHPFFFGMVAEISGEVVGSNFLDERSPIAGLGPITVDPKVQNRRVGRHLMEAALERVRARASAGVRLVQAAYHVRSLALYATLGFQAREELACMQGSPIGVTFAGYLVRKATEADLDSCDRVCTLVHGHQRRGEVTDAIKQSTATVVEHDDRITGYATDVGYFAHAVGETNHDLMALIAAAPAFSGPGILVPVRNGTLFQWCLGRGLRVTQVMTLMTMGMYNEPAGAYLPSILY